MLVSLLEIPKIVADTLWFEAEKPIYEFGSRQVAGGGGKAADLRRFFPGKPYVGVDLEPGPGVDVLWKDVVDESDAGGQGPGLRGHLEDKTAAVICMEVLEHARDPELLVDAIYDMLVPDGWALFTTPFNFPLHSPPDYRRYTPAGLDLLLGKRFAIVVMLPTQPVDMPLSVVALALKSPAALERHAKELEAFQARGVQWCRDYTYPLKPASGDVVLLCPHADPIAGGLGWSWFADPLRLATPDGREIRSRWGGMCAECRQKAGLEIDLSLFARDGIYP